MARKDNSKLKELIAEYGIKDLNDVHEFVKMLTVETIQATLDSELDNELGYSKYDYKNKHTSNSRNSYSPKTVQGSKHPETVTVSLSHPDEGQTRGRFSRHADEGTVLSS